MLGWSRSALPTSGFLSTGKFLQGLIRFPARDVVTAASEESNECPNKSSRAPCRVPLPSQEPAARRQRFRGTSPIPDVRGMSFWQAALFSDVHKLEETTALSLCISSWPRNQAYSFGTPPADLCPHNAPVTDKLLEAKPHSIFSISTWENQARPHTSPLHDNQAVSILLSMLAGDRVKSVGFCSKNLLAINVDPGSYTGMQEGLPKTVFLEGRAAPKNSRHARGALRNGAQKKKKTKQKTAFGGGNQEAHHPRKYHTQTMKATALFQHATGFDTKGC